MKKILLSLAAIVAVAGVVAGVTVAYYNDTETSAGNVFVAGSVDLKVDHTKQTYNSLDCNTASVVVKSDTTNKVVAMSADGTDPVPFPHDAVLVSSINPAWTANIPDAQWIWSQNPTPAAEKNIDTTYTFENTFPWMGPVTGATLVLNIGADNSYEVYLNDVLVKGDNTEQNYNSSGQDTVTGTQISDKIVQGQNTLRFVVKNWARPAGATWDNPGGLIYKLTINGNPTGDYFKAHCQLWNEKDLSQGDTFFNFNDVKPGDSGTNVISLHIHDNDSYACLIAGDKVDAENAILESETGDVTPDAGELSKYINVFVWADADGDGLYEPAGETPYGSGPLSTLANLMSMDSGNGQYLTSANVSNVGIAWCAGTLAVSDSGAFTCNGSSMLNDAQSDSFSATLTAYAEQKRNNDQFLCSGVQLPPVTPY